MDFSEDEAATPAQNLTKSKYQEDTESQDDENNNSNSNSKNKKKKKKEKKKKRKRIHVKMELVHEQPEKIAPLVGYFPSGYDPEKKNESEEEEEPDVRVYRNKVKHNRLQLVVSPKRSKVDFVGTNHLGEAGVAQVCTYALGVLDKETQTLKIVPIASNKIFRLEPRVVGVDHGEEEVVEELKEEDITAEERANKISDLTILYGTKRSRNQAKKLASLNQKEDPAAQEDLENKLKEVMINKEALEIVEGHTGRNIPPHDSTATIPEKAYPLDKIILKGELNYVLEILELMESGEEIMPKDYPSFVCNRARKLLEIQDELQKKKLACILSYITHLIKFKDQRSFDYSDSAKNHTIPSILYKKFTNMFTESGRHEPSTEKRNLLISYVLVLTLFADEFRTDPSDIAKDLRMPTMSIREHYKSLGCKLQREEKMLFVTLPVPLQFPRPRMERRRR